MTVLSVLPELLRSAWHIVVFTGAGVSAESGISTFRDDLTGLWSRFDAEDLATPDAFRRDPDLVWGWYEWRRMNVLRASPNAGCEAIAAMARHVPKLTLITQNVDDLHERAGSGSVIHLHGSLFVSTLLLPAPGRRGSQTNFRTSRKAGAAVVQINPNPTPLDGLAQFNLLGPSAQVLARLIENTWHEN